MADDWQPTVAVTRGWPPGRPAEAELHPERFDPDTGALLPEYAYLYPDGFDFSGRTS